MSGIQSMWGGVPFIDESQSSGSSALSAVSNATAILKGTRVRVTRPNNVTAYAAGQVIGDAADARVELVIPAAPNSNWRTPFVGPNFSIRVVRGAPYTQGTLSFNIWVFNAQPATVLGDQQAFSLSDADVQNKWVPSIVNAQAGTQSVSIVAAAQGSTVTLNTSAGTAGRVAATASFFAQGIPGQLGLFVPGQSIWLYLVATAAYTPLALETLDIIPYYSTNYVVSA